MGLDRLWHAAESPLFWRKGTACNSWPSVAVRAPSSSCQMHLLQTIIHQHLKLLLFVTQTTVLLQTWQWNYKTYITHYLLYSWTAYLSQCVNQDCQHTAAESQSNHTEVTLQDRKHSFANIWLWRSILFPVALLWFLTMFKWMCRDHYCWYTILPHCIVIQKMSWTHTVHSSFQLLHSTCISICLQSTVDTFFYLW